MRGVRRLTSLESTADLDNHMTATVQLPTLKSVC